MSGLRETIDLNLQLGSRTNPAIRCADVTFNTALLSAADADGVIERESDRLGLPVADPIRGGEQFERLVAACLA